MQASLEKLCRNETFMNTVELQYLSGIEGEVDSFGLLMSFTSNFASLYTKHKPVHTRYCA